MAHGDSCEFVLKHHIPYEFFVHFRHPYSQEFALLDRYTYVRNEDEFFQQLELWDQKQ